MNNCIYNCDGICKYINSETNEPYNDKCFDDNGTSCSYYKVDITEITTRLQNEIERLKEENKNLKQAIENDFTYETTQGDKMNVLTLVRQQAIEEFAEKLKSKLDEQKHFYEVAKIGYKDISLAALNTTYKMLDDLLKEYGVNNE